MYFRYVHGITLPNIAGYHDGSMTILDGVNDQNVCHNWQQISRPIDNKTLFLAYHHGEPCHVGVVIDENYVLHANGKDNKGQVQYHRLDILERHYQKIEFYRYSI